MQKELYVSVFIHTCNSDEYGEVIDTKLVGASFDHEKAEQIGIKYQDTWECINKEAIESGTMYDYGCVVEKTYLAESDHDKCHECGHHGHDVRICDISHQQLCKKCRRE